ncbi:MAG: hypothetical protein H2172_16255 [Opitutus sp.]|nr:hypothetical protein [Opitutus sp.]MCS6299813.1 hypothetical protein [Opitutus sp.]
MSKLVFDVPILSISNGAQDQSLSRGFFVQASGQLVSAATGQLPLGVILDGGVANVGRSAVLLSGSGKIAKVKLNSVPGSIVVGSFLTLRADGTVGLDQGTGTARVQVARALEAGAANELIDAILLDTVALA